MIWKTKTHEFSATICQKTGKPCPALARMARAMADAIATAQPVTTKEFEVEGSGELSHCAEGCTARFRAHSDLIRVYCGTASETPTTKLDDYADMMFGTSLSAMSTGTLSDMPCAMLEVTTLGLRPAAGDPQPAMA
ncbi:hypothetical protein [Ruegeria sp. HKCCD7251]|uniref:hypothetical protein n=2 Tax=unclassified Ruegeria TaxID=2625375 RepID=UPI0014882098|nr:hypothetical protein [Ruegeria sp. HKCCD7251]